MWNIASNPFGVRNNNYIKENGKLYNGVGELGNEYVPYQSKIKDKIKSQFHQEDVPGIVFHENSSAAKAISKSYELKNFINQNSKILESGKEISGSFGFTSDGNLNNAFGKIDVLSAKRNGDYIDVMLLDTYDFNPNDTNIKVQMGYYAQKAGLLNPYFTIVKCRYKL